MLFRDNDQRRKFAATFLYLGQTPGDGEILQRFARDLLGHGHALTVIELLTATTEVTLKQLMLPAIMALAHGPVGVDAWITKHQENVDAAERWAQSLAASMTPHGVLPPAAQDNGFYPNGIPPQVVG